MGDDIRKAVTEVYDVQPIAVSGVKAGANRQPFFLFKSRKSRDGNPIGLSDIAKAVGELLGITKAKWSKAFINDLPDAAFAVIEPAYKSGDTDNKGARHLPHHGPEVTDPNDDETVDLPHLKNALSRAGQIEPITDSINAEELRQKAISHLRGHAKRLGIGDEEVAKLMGEEVSKGSNNFEDQWAERQTRQDLIEKAGRTFSKKHEEALKATSTALRTQADEIDKMLSILEGKDEEVDDVKKEELIEVFKSEVPAIVRAELESAGLIKKAEEPAKTKEEGSEEVKKSADERLDSIESTLADIKKALKMDPGSAQSTGQEEDGTVKKSDVKWPSFHAPAK